MGLKKLIGWAGAMLCFAGFVYPSNGWAGNLFSILHDFTGDIPASKTIDGANPAGALATDGTTFYGMTPAGGAFGNGNGIIFSVSSDGKTYNVVHSFGASNVVDANGNTVDDGLQPHGSLLLSGSTLYGMANEGGYYNDGVVFSINTDGSKPTVLHSFGDPSVTKDGQDPMGTLILSSGTLYGMTGAGGYSGNGVVFQVDADGSGYKILHYFGDGTVAGDGFDPGDCLILSGSTLYGMTQFGGYTTKENTSGYGVVFEINLEGDQPTYKILHTFGDGTVANDGKNPVGGLVLSGSTLYGLTQSGGVYGYGTVFGLNIGTDGAKPTILHSFKRDASTDGWNPMGSLTAMGSTFYGVTSQGGEYGWGTLFEINPSSGHYSVLHSFGDGTTANDAASPCGTLVLSNSTFYGMTSETQAVAGTDYLGTVYSFYTPTTYTLTVNETGAGSGTVTSNVSGIDCGSSTCSAPFAIGSSVTLTAAADTGSTFAGWSGACSGKSSSCKVTMSAAETVTAGFKANQTIGALSFNPTTLTMCGTTKVTASATSGLPVSFATTTPSVCKVSSTGVVTGLSMGTCTIAANQGGNSNYNAAPRVKGNIAMACPTFTASTVSGQIPLAVKFTVESVLASGAIASWHWSFGDGGTSAAKDPSHTYTKAGTYTVKLTLTSVTGGRAVVTKTSYITAQPDIM